MSSSSSIQQARAALGKRLREIRRDSGLTARELAARAGWHESKCSRIENGRTPPSDHDLRVYTLRLRQLDDRMAGLAQSRDVLAGYIAAAERMSSRTYPPFDGIDPEPVPA
ncbi:helix-turn-helix domain-containing protein [Streptomyces sp. NPDC097107]|uniref:helix-turn-helix domain-containing protein n=1 Tax=Streptomyces sp. NPDC097107 TaxID=3366089 RepID=UPI0038051D4C